MIDPECELDGTEQSELASVRGMQGWKVVQKVMRIVVEQARVDLDNADPARPAEVTAKHALSRATAVAVTRITDRINIEVSQFHGRPKASDQPTDETELAMDDIERITETMPNLLGEVLIEEER